MSNANVTLTDVLDRGILAVPGVADSVAAAALATPSDVDQVVKSAFSKVDIVAVDPGLGEAILQALDPAGRASAVISAKYAELGGAGGILGPTSGAVTVCADGFGYYRHFRSGSIFWHPAAGAHEVHGPIRAKWAALSWERGFLGYPTSDQQPGADTDQRGDFNTFQGGAIHWYPPGIRGILSGVEVAVNDVTAAAIGIATVGSASATPVAAPVSAVAAAVPISSAIAAAALPSTRFVTVDGPGIEAAQFLGKLDQIGVGAGIHLPGEAPMELGSSAGAFEVHGEIGVHYRALGGSGSVLGYPTTDETGTPDGIGRYNHFQAGSIYWTPGTGAHEVHGLIRSFWAAAGWERNAALGYPVSDELIPDRRIGHRFPERRKKALGLPPDVLKLPIDAVASGFPRSVVNTPAVTAAPVSPVARFSRSVAAATEIQAAEGLRPDAASIAAASASAGAAAPISAAQRAGVFSGVDAGTVVHIDPNIGAGIAPLDDPASEPGPVPSENRFGDFENGVVFWVRGATAARQLQPWATSADGNAMKRSPAEVLVAFESILVPALGGLDGFAYAGSAFVGTTGYSADGASVHNRAHRFIATLNTTSSGSGGLFGGLFGGLTLPIQVELDVEIAFDPQRREVVAYLTGWSGGDAGGPSLVRQLHPRLDTLLYRRVELIDIPDTEDGNPIALLSAKTMPDGTVALFVEPRDLLVAPGVLTGIHDGITSVINR
ncbi:LGFP repeat-containing protein [Microbacterium sp. ASV49]|uniref:LGFP repeat-containing protein n=1 Tax=Microbacterium candidum TaxID=3041922 RepID=A0ABT7N006_9MICO|nr:hypothetical protein [Microbacterium sp. ASV49]MDL9980029.1 hypothetical protein [Microbacterium sp. ASV49]